VSLCDAAGEAPLIAAGDFVFEHQLQELQVAERLLLRLLEADLQGVEHAAQAQFLEIGLQVVGTNHW